MSPAAIATNAHCGQVVTVSLTLNGDLNCGSGDGLTVTGKSVVLNLNGHKITGGGGGYGNGVTLQAASDTVENGLVTNFGTGVTIYGSTDTVLNMRATSNSYGILDYGTGNKITTSVASANNYNGIYSSGTGGTYSGDHEISNGLTTGYAGLLLSGGANITVISNIANGNGGYGILDFGNGTKLTKNIADFNVFDGIYAQDAAVIDGGGNTAKGNDYGTGYAPKQCYAVACS